MSSVLVRLKILPRDAEARINELLESVKSHLPEKMQIVSVREEPIAFGILAAIVDIRMEDKEGSMENLENALRSSAAVSDLQILAISRSGTTLH